jgi:hypothetical protein
MERATWDWRWGGMTLTRNSDAEPSLPLMIATTVVVGLVVSVFALLYWVMQPRALENPGMAAYHPPAGTRLEPLPRKFDAPELAELPPAAVAPVLAETQPSPAAVQAPKREAHARAKKQPTARARRETPPPPNSYAQQSSPDPRRFGGWSWF